jgi:hypothetical protein
MRIKTVFLLLFFTVGLLPFPIQQVQAEETIRHSLDDAISLMYISDALLLDVDFPEEGFHSPALFSPSWDNLAVDPYNAVLAAALHSLKGMRNDLDAKCKLLVAHFRQQGKDCEAEKVQSLCDQQKQEINSEIGKLHDKRGDRRRGPTKVWHWLKRSGRGFWYRIGPIGRNFLRKVGPEALQMAATGGLSGGVLKNLLKHTAKSMGRDRIRQIVYQGVARLLQGQIELAEAAGVDICDSNESEPESTTEGTEEEVSQDAVLTYSLTTEEIEFWWHSMFEPKEDFHVCGKLSPDKDDWFNPIEFQLTIDPQKETIQAKLEGSREIKNSYDGVLHAQINQNFIVKLEGPYQLTEKVAELVLYLQGSFDLTLTQSGKVLCHYWEVPSSGDPVLIEYWVEGNETKTLAPEYLMIVSTEDQNTGKLQLRIGYEMEPWGINTGFYIITGDYELSTDELNNFRVE